MTVQFKDVAIGSQFIFNDVKYEKIPEIRVSCCTAHTAQEVGNPNSKIQILPLVEVEVLENK
jgi:hypothetical protein